jgi:hypothetical protein
MGVSTSIAIKDAYEIFYSTFPESENLLPFLTGIVKYFAPMLVATVDLAAILITIAACVLRVQ